VTARIFFDPAAQSELDEAADFYDLQSAGLGERFLDAVYAIAHQSRRPGYWQNRP